MLKNLIFLFGFSTFVTVVWIISAIHHNKTTSRITPANQIRIEPIDPTFNVEAINQLKTREAIQTNLTERSIIVEDDDINESLDATGSGTLDNELDTTPDINP